MKIALACGIVLALYCLSCSPSTGGLRADRLRCEYLDDPLGLDAAPPRLGWQVISEQRGQHQTAYQVLVASSADTLDDDKGDLWDSGKVSSVETVNVPYGGDSLPARQQCYWKVRVWDRDGRPSPWSRPAHWSMGLLAPGDWTAQWISFKDGSPVATDADVLSLPPARYYRHEWRAGQPVRRATIYATALGQYELHLNGQRVGEARFTPGWSDYHRRVYYNTYDVTDLVREGDNAIGAIVADGWYAGYVGFARLRSFGANGSGRNFYGKTPALRVQLEIENEDGSRTVVNSSPDWRVSAGPILEADIQMGETYDARLEMPGWASPGFDDGGWASAIPASANGAVQQYVGGRLCRSRLFSYGLC